MTIIAGVVFLCPAHTGQDWSKASPKSNPVRAVHGSLQTGWQSELTRCRLPVYYLNKQCFSPSPVCQLVCRPLSPSFFSILPLSNLQYLLLPPITPPSPVSLSLCLSFTQSFFSLLPLSLPPSLSFFWMTVFNDGMVWRGIGSTGHLGQTAYRVDDGKKVLAIAASCSILEVKQACHAIEWLYKKCHRHSGSKTLTTFNALGCGFNSDILQALV